MPKMELKCPSCGIVHELEIPRELKEIEHGELFCICGALIQFKIPSNGGAELN